VGSDAAPASPCRPSVKERLGGSARGVGETNIDRGAHFAYKGCSTPAQKVMSVRMMRAMLSTALARPLLTMTPAIDEQHAVGESLAKDHFCVTTTSSCRRPASLRITEETRRDQSGFEREVGSRTGSAVGCMQRAGDSRPVSDAGAGQLRRMQRRPSRPVRPTPAAREAALERLSARLPLT